MSSKKLNSNGKNGYPCLIPDFRGKDFSLSPVSMVGVGVFVDAFYQDEVIGTVLAQSKS